VTELRPTQGWASREIDECLLFDHEESNFEEETNVYHYQAGDTGAYDRGRRGRVRRHVRGAGQRAIDEQGPTADQPAPTQKAHI